MLDLSHFPLGPFARKVDECGEMLALKDSSYEFTFTQVDRFSDSVASFLAQKVRQGDRVGILMDRSPLLVVGIIALIKLGAVYVPIDPEAPLERIEFMRSAGQLRLLLMSARQENRATTDVQIPILFIEHLLDSGNQFVPVGIEERDPFVLFFTSGSTGRPKGVLLSYAGYRNNFQQMVSLLGISTGMKVAQLASPSFDISFTELWMPLLVGAPVFFVPEAAKKNPWKLRDWILQNEVEVMQFVPSFFSHFLLALEGSNVSFPSINKLLFIGESLPYSIVIQWFKHHASTTCRVYNLYGPVEASVEVSGYVIDKNILTASETGIVPIGKPFEGVEFTILDEDGKESEEGVLHLGGIQLANGYLDPEQTAKAFFFHNGKRIYNTGDIVQKLSDGNYQFLCRKDRQVKLRGFRVELGEIEEAILTVQGVQRAAVVLTKTVETSELIAFIQSKDPIEEEIKQGISQFLPLYMMPQRWIHVSSIPLNVNGKTDYPLLEKKAKEERL